MFLEPADKEDSVKEAPTQLVLPWRKGSKEVSAGEGFVGFYNPHLWLTGGSARLTSFMPGSYYRGSLDDPPRIRLVHALTRGASSGDPQGIPSSVTPALCGKQEGGLGRNIAGIPH